MKTAKKFRVINQLRKLYPTGTWYYPFHSDVGAWVNDELGTVYRRSRKTAFPSIELFEFIYIDRDGCQVETVPIIYENEFIEEENA